MEKSWENMELAGTSDRPHGSLSARMDTKDGSKKLSMTFQHFYTTSTSALAQAGQQAEDGNLKTALQGGLESWHHCHSQNWGHPEQGASPDVP